jgi:hypothetical protein
MAQAYINPAILTWAVARSGLTPEELATSSVTADSIRAWMKGERLPTETQGEALATKLRGPFLVVFLDSPPEMSSRSVGPSPCVRSSYPTTCSLQLRKHEWGEGHRVLNSFCPKRTSRIRPQSESQADLHPRWLDPRLRGRTSDARGYDLVRR